MSATDPADVIADALAATDPAEHVAVSSLIPGDIVDMFTAYEIGADDLVMAPTIVDTVERDAAAPYLWSVTGHYDDTGSTVTRRYVDGTELPRYAVAMGDAGPVCRACAGHPGWSHGDTSRRTEPGDVCRACYGSGVTQ